MRLPEQHAATLAFAYTAPIVKPGAFVLVEAVGEPVNIYGHAYIPTRFVSGPAEYQPLFAAGVFEIHVGALAPLSRAARALYDAARALVPTPPPAAATTEETR